MKLKDLHPDSKVWIYSSDREMTPTEMTWLNEQLEAFAVDWASHGKNLRAAAEVLNPFFVALAVDLTHENASGCSIDKSVHLMKQVGNELGINFFDRLKIWIQNEDGSHQSVHFKDLANYPAAMTYDTLLETLGQLEQGFKVRTADYLKMRQVNTI